MTGLLRYAFLKNSRDGSLITLLVAPTAMTVLPMLVVSLFDRSISHIPAEAAQILPITISSLMAALASFLVFRTEIANHAIGSFVLATRPVTVPLASILYGSLIGLGAAVTTMAAFAATFTSWPPAFGHFLARAFMIALISASTATLAAMLTRSMAAIAWVYGLILILTGVSDDFRTGTGLMLSISLITAALSVGVSTFLLERRCAS
jgi:hypothetical protein